jgi:hypothetical protein
MSAVNLSVNTPSLQIIIDKEATNKIPKFSAKPKLSESVFQKGIFKKDLSVPQDFLLKKEVAPMEKSDTTQIISQVMSIALNPYTSSSNRISEINSLLNVFPEYSRQNIYRELGSTETDSVTLKTLDNIRLLLNAMFIHTPLETIGDETPSPNKIIESAISLASDPLINLKNKNLGVNALFVDLPIKIREEIYIKFLTQTDPIQHKYSKRWAQAHIADNPSLLCTILMEVLPLEITEESYSLSKSEPPSPSLEPKTERREYVTDIVSPDSSFNFGKDNLDED